MSLSLNFVVEMFCGTISGIGDAAVGESSMEMMLVMLCSVDSAIQCGWGWCICCICYIGVNW
jgi:hypothetical protein